MQILHGHAHDSRAHQGARDTLSYARARMDAFGEIHDILTSFPPITAYSIDETSSLES